MGFGDNAGSIDEFVLGASCAVAMAIIKLKIYIDMPTILFVNVTPNCSDDGSLTTTQLSSLPSCTPIVVMDDRFIG